MKAADVEDGNRPGLNQLIQSPSNPGLDSFGGRSRDESGGCFGGLAGHLGQDAGVGVRREVVGRAPIISCTPLMSAPPARVMVAARWCRSWPDRRESITTGCPNLSRPVPECGRPGCLLRPRSYRIELCVQVPTSRHLQCSRVQGLSRRPLAGDVRRDDGPGRAAGTDSSRSLAITCDVTDEDSVAAAVDATVERFGVLDAAVNTAGTFGAIGPIAQARLADAAEVVAVNLTGMWLCVKHQARAMIATGGGGAIVTTGSVASLMGERGVPGVHRHPHAA
ncbi:SDR family NAD(P)-dependent oxidoreductase [Actinokineospora sp.]|uniref:SDR family NAD(P)-dependent oxidoreductase n=1 Tax=Actinokineospora sp. TaxID=1872133 RepID=UPI003D6AC3AF